MQNKWKFLLASLGTIFSFAKLESKSKRIGSQAYAQFSSIQPGSFLLFVHFYVIDKETKIFYRAHLAKDT